MPLSRKAARRKPSNAQRTFYVGAEYIDSGDRLLVEDGDAIDLYSVNLELAQHWYAAAWRGRRFEARAFQSRCIDPGMEVEQAQRIKESGLVLAQCLRHGEGMPVVDTYNGHPIYGSAVEILIGEVFEAALGHLIEDQTGIAGLTISPMHTGYALKDGRSVGRASIESVASSVKEERPDLAPHAAPDGTVTIFFSDIVGSTSLNEKLGDERWMSVLREHNEIVRREKGIHRGFEVQTIGDAFMLAFRSAREAVRCAIGIQRAFARRKRGAKTVVHVRIGVHTGELVREGDDFIGRHVNFAARVGSEAEAGEIVVSALVRELIEPSGEFSFQPRGAVRLKGLKGMHRLHSVLWSPPRADEAPNARPPKRARRGPPRRA